MLFNESERELIEAAQLVLQDGVRRLKDRENLFPTNRSKWRNVRQEAREAREAKEALTLSLITDYGSSTYERAVAVLIDAQGRLIAIEEFPRGKASSVSLSPRLLAGFVIDHGASAVLLAHNHPSGNCSPSKEDIAVTDFIGAWLGKMECALIDHLVLTAGDSCSILGEW